MSQIVEVDDHSVSKHTDCSIVQDSFREKAEQIGAFRSRKRPSGIVSALIVHEDVCRFGH